jgi:ABC-type branched-subunit amino acid transport system substrate-binding protein
MATAASFFALAACSVLIDHTDSQCANDDDCAKFGATVCVNGGCIAGTPPPEAGLLDLVAPPVSSSTCTTTQDCLSEHNGVNYICRRDNTCQSLVTEDCPAVFGSYAGDDTVLIGAILPLAGPHASTGAALRDAITLGVSDFGVGLTPLSDGGLRRQVAVVFCDEFSNADRAAMHLLDDLDIAIFIGTSDTASTLDVVGHQIAPKGGLLMSPRATADLSAFMGTGLLWRTAPSYVTEADAIVALLERTVAPALAVSGDGGSDAGAPRVAIVHATDVTSTDLDGRISFDLPPGGAVLDVAYGNPDDLDAAAPDYASAITAVVGASPDVIILLGSTQAVTNVLGGLETNWPLSKLVRRPQYILSSGLQVPELLTYVAGAAAMYPTLPARILGTAPGAAPTDSNRATFLVNYKDTFHDGTDPEIFGVAQAYDALYTLAYAASATRNSDLVGTDVRNALRVVLTPPDGGPAPISAPVDPTAISTTLAAIARGSTLSLGGASGPLAFETTTGDITGDIQVWCVLPSSAPGAASYVFQSSGESYSASAAAIKGAVGRGCTP